MLGRFYKLHDQNVNEMTPVTYEVRDFSPDTGWLTNFITQVLHAVLVALQILAQKQEREETQEVVKEIHCETCTTNTQGHRETPPYRWKGSLTRTRWTIRVEGTGSGELVKDETNMTKQTALIQTAVLMWALTFCLPRNTAIVLKKDVCSYQTLIQIEQYN